jgi:type IV pilus assembly protein PilB
LGEREIPPEIQRLIPGGLARLHRALPVRFADNVLSVALVDPFDLRVAEDLRFALGKDVHVVVSPTEQIEDRIKRYYGTETSSMEDILKQLGDAGELMTLRGDDGSPTDVEAEANATPIIRFVDLIMFQAIQDRASDIHFEPFRANVFVTADGAQTE